LTYGANGTLDLNNLNGQTKLIGKNASEAFGLIPRDVMKFRNSSLSEFNEILNDLNLKRDIKISAPEQFMPALVTNGLRKIDYFPVGVGEVQTIVVPFTDDGFDVVEVSIYGLVPVESRPIFSEEIKRILANSYVKVWQGSGNFGYLAIYERS
jgi:hypothetical protein